MSVSAHRIGGNRAKMKRCVICGNIGDDNSTACEVCGNPYEETGEATDRRSEAGQNTASEVNRRNGQFAKTAEKIEQKTEEQTVTEKSGHTPQKQDAGSRRTKETAQRGVQKGKAAARPRRANGAPQIYGQESMDPEMLAQYGAQGMVRREVSSQPARNTSQGMNGRPANAAQGMNGRPANAPQGMNSRPANASQGMNSRPANAPQGMNGRPTNAPQGMNGRPANMTQGMNGRPINGMQNPMGYRPVEQSVYGSSRVKDAARAAFQSPLFLLSAILFTVHFISSVAAIFMHELNHSQFIRLISGFDLPSQLTGYMDSLTNLLSRLDSGAIAVNLILCIPGLLLCIGLWTIVATVRTADEEMSGVGFGFLKAVVIIGMVKSFAVMLLLLVLSVVLLVSAWGAGVLSTKVLSAVLLVVMIAAAMMVIMYYFCYLATLKTFRRNTNTGEIYGRVSGYVAVMHMILALTSIVTLLSGIVNAEITSITGAVGNMGAMILFGIWMLLYKKSVEEAE